MAQNLLSLAIVFFSHIHICLSNSLNYCSYVTSCTKKVHVLTPVASLCLSPFDFLPESFFSQYPHILPKCPCSSPCLLCFSQDTRYISHILTSFRSVKLSDGPLILLATCTALCYFEVLKAIWSILIFLIWLLSVSSTKMKTSWGQGFLIGHCYWNLRNIFRCMN